VVRNGYLVREWYGVPAFASSTFDIWSCSKSLTVTAFGLLFDYIRNHKLPNDAQIAMDSRAYDFIPAGHPFSDPRNEMIPLRHLLTMTSGIPRENRGIISLSVVPGQGEFEFALGKQRDRFGFSAGTMVADPGKVWDYFDPAYAHLSLIFSQVDRPGNTQLAETESQLRIRLVGEHGRYELAECSERRLCTDGLRFQPLLRCAFTRSGRGAPGVSPPTVAGGFTLTSRRGFDN
jgi:Beta-lactamase